MQERRSVSTRVLHVPNCGTVIERRGHFTNRGTGCLLYGAPAGGGRASAPCWSLRKAGVAPPLAPLLGLALVRGVSALGVSPHYRCSAPRRQLSIGAPESTTTAVDGSQTHGSPSLGAPLGSRFFRAVNRSLRSARLGPCDRLALRSSRLALIGASESGCRASNPCCCQIR